MGAHHSEMHSAMHTALFAHDLQHPPAAHTHRTPTIQLQMDTLILESMKRYETYAWIQIL